MLPAKEMIKKLFLEELEKIENTDIDTNRIDLNFNIEEAVPNSSLIHIGLFDKDDKPIAYRLSIVFYKNDKNKIMAFWENIKLREQYHNSKMIDDLNNFIIGILTRLNKGKK